VALRQEIKAALELLHPLAVARKIVRSRTVSAAARNPSNLPANSQSRSTGLINVNMFDCVIATAQSRNTPGNN
jgi:hypothetical protein